MLTRHTHIVLAALLGASFTAAAGAQTLTPGNLLLTATNPATGVQNLFLLDAVSGNLLSLHAGAPLVSPRHMPSVTNVNPYDGRADVYIADGTSTRHFRLSNTNPAVHLGAWVSPSTVESVISWDEIRRISDERSSLFTLDPQTQIEDDLFMYHDARERFGSPFASQNSNAVTSLTATSLRMLNPSNFAAQQYVAIGSSQMGGPHGDPVMSTIGSVAGVNDGRWSVAVLFGAGGVGEPASLRVFDEGADEFVTILSGGPLTNPRAIAPVLLNTYDDGFYVANAATGAPGSVGAIIKVDSDGSHSVVASGGFLMRPIAMVVDDAGFIIVADDISLNGHGSIIRIDPSTGAQAEIRRGSGSTGFRIPSSLSILRCNVPVWTVTRADDALNANPGNGSPNAVGGGITVRSAITEANLHPCGGAIVRLPADHHTMSLFGFNEDNNLSGDFDVHSFVRIRGAGMRDSVIDGDEIDGIFDIFSPDGALFLSELTLTNARRLSGGGGGGGVRGQDTGIALRRVLVENCESPSSGGVSAGGGHLYAFDTEFSNNAATNGQSGGASVFTSLNSPSTPLGRFVRCTFANNTATSRGGGLFAGSSTLVTIQNSTFVGNESGWSGGAMHLNGGAVSMTLCTIVNNAAGLNLGAPAREGGGINNAQAGVLFSNSIVTGNTATGAAPDLYQLDVSSTFQTFGYNLLGDVSGVTFIGDTSTHILGVNPGLAPLADNGGYVRTRALNPGSPAIDNANPGIANITDARGVMRPIDGNFSGVARADIGAFERIPTCQGDVNGDGVVDFTDFSAVLNNYGNAGLAIFGDVNGDNVVDFTDFSIVLGVYGTACP